MHRLAHINFVDERGGYVVNVSRGQSTDVPGYDLTVIDDSDHVGIGDWYEKAEEVFYRPSGSKIPSDSPLATQGE